MKLVNTVCFSIHYVISGVFTKCLDKIHTLQRNVIPLTLVTLHAILQVLRLDITPMMPSSHNSEVNHARLVTFAPQALNQLLVITDGARLIKFSASNGQLLNEVAHIHRTECTSLSVDRGGRYLLTTGDKTLKVWDYTMALDLNFQVSHWFIKFSHSHCGERPCKVCYHCNITCMKIQWLYLFSVWILSGIYWSF